jgi:small GTP-binding protein
MSVGNDYKVTIIGQGGVGKSSIVDRVVRNYFNDKTVNTIGAAFSTITFKNHKFQIWDTAGQERFKSLIPMYLRNSRIVLMVYDVTDEASLETIETHWLDFVKTNTHNAAIPCDILVIGNKNDLDDGTRNNVVQPLIYHAQDLCEIYRLPHLLVSAKTGANIDKIFPCILKLINDRTINDRNKNNQNANDDGNNENDGIVDLNAQSNQFSSCFGNSCNII